MLTLDPASACEVCAESFGPGHVPAVIPCGHVFCAQCLATIVDKTSPRLTPACPLCRGTFSDKTWRLIRVDLGGTTCGSGWSGAESDHVKDEGAARVRADARRLEEKVHAAAAKKCSFEEVSALHKEVQDWLSHDKHTSKTDPQHAGLRLSADLLRAILLNCLAYTDATKEAKTKQAGLQAKIDSLELDLRRQRDQVAIKTEECERLRDELNKLRPNNASKSSSSTTRAMPSTPPQRPGTSLGFSSSGNSSTRYTSASTSASAHSTPSRSSSVAPRARTSSTTSAAPPLPVSSFRNDSPPESPAILPPAPIPGLMSLAPSPTSPNLSLASQAAAALPLRPQTPAALPVRPQTPAAPLPVRPQTPAASTMPVRPQTPAAMPVRSQTPAASPARPQTPAAMPVRSQTPAASPVRAPASSPQRSKTPTPSSLHRRSSSSSAAIPPVPQRPSTAMGSRHERWLPGGHGAVPPVPPLPPGTRGSSLRFPTRLGGMGGGGFPIVQEAD